MFKSTIISVILLSVISDCMSASVDLANAYTKHNNSDIRRSSDAASKFDNGDIVQAAAPSAPVNSAPKTHGLLRGGYPYGGGYSAQAAPLIVPVAVPQAYSIPVAPIAPVQYQPIITSDYSGHSYDSYGGQYGYGGYNLYGRDAAAEKIPASMTLEPPVEPSVSYQTRYVIKPQEVALNGNEEYVSEPLDFVPQTETREASKIVGFRILPSSAASYADFSAVGDTRIQPSYSRDQFYSVQPQYTQTMRAAAPEEFDPNTLAQSGASVFIEYDPSLSSMIGQQQPEPNLLQSKAVGGVETPLNSNGFNAPSMNWFPSSSRDGKLKPFSHEYITKTAYDLWLDQYTNFIFNENQKLQKQNLARMESEELRERGRISNVIDDSKVAAIVRNVISQLEADKKNLSNIQGIKDPQERNTMAEEKKPTAA